MTVETLRSFVRRQPFEPFSVYMADGRSIDVAHPDFILLPPGWRSSEVIVARPDGTWDFVYLKNVTSIQSRGSPPAAPAARGGGGAGDSGDAGSER